MLTARLGFALPFVPRLDVHLDSATVVLSLRVFGEIHPLVAAAFLICAFA